MGVHTDRVSDPNLTENQFNHFPVNEKDGLFHSNNDYLCNS